MELVRFVVVIRTTLSHLKEIKREQSFQVKITTTPLLPDATAIAMTYRTEDSTSYLPKEIMREKKGEEHIDMMTQLVITL